LVLRDALFPLLRDGVHQRLMLHRLLVHEEVIKRAAKRCCGAQNIRGHIIPSSVIDYTYDPGSRPGILPIVFRIGPAHCPIFSSTPGWRLGKLPTLYWGALDSAEVP